jgi:N-acetylmuramoyl-L-alanine amidase
MAKKQTVLFIDAGHGGLDPMTKEYLTPANIGKKTLHTNGKAYHYNGWFYEGHFNRQIANEFITMATAAGFHCIPVFHPFKDNNLKERTDNANSIYSQLNQKALFLSFHANAAGIGTAPQTTAEGVCSFVYKLGSETANTAQVMTKELEKIFDKYGSRRRSTLVLDNSLHITTYTTMPAILLELGFFDNPNNADLLINPTFRTALVRTMIETLKTRLA